MATYGVSGRASFAALLLSQVLASPAIALVNEAVVSNTGVDSAACGPPSNPCRTLQRAHNNVVAGGEVDIINTGEFGPVIINKSISIVNASAGEASVTQALAGGSAIVISAGFAGVVHLRGLNLDGQNSAAFGVRVASVGALDIVDCAARRFTNIGVFIAPTVGSKVLIDNTIVSDNGNGVYIRPTQSFRATINRTTISNNTVYGLYVSGALAPQVATVFVSVVDSSATRNQQGFHAVSAATTATTRLALNNVAASSNVFGVVAATASQVSLAHSLVSDNSNSGARPVGGTIFSLVDNSFRLNAIDVSGGAMTPYSPK